MDQKVAFFTELFALDEDEDETEDSEDPAVIMRQFKAPCKPHISEEEEAPLERTTSALVPNASSSQAASSSIQSSSQPTRMPPAIGNSNTSSPVEVVKPAKAAPKMKGKRKRVHSPKLIPDSQQIFKGLAFYFIPNNDVSPSRRFRINKAMERGALWVREWRPDVTHIIADKYLTYKDIVSFLKLNAIPAGVALVTEDYPAACISYQMVLNPNQIIYHVEGFEQPIRKGNSLCPISLHGKNVSYNNPVTQGFEQPGRAENALCGTSLSAESVFANGLSKAASHESDPKSPKVGPQCVPVPGKEGPAGNNYSASHSAMISKASNELSRDALDEAIEEVAVFKDLPLDFDEDSEPMEIVADELDEGNSENERQEARSKRKKQEKPWQQSFSCMHKHDGNDTGHNPNLRTIEILQKMLSYYDRTNDHWRTLAYRKAISALRKQDSKVMTKEEASDIPFIGQRLAAKIEEIVWTDRLRRLENTNLEPNDLTLQRFLKIYGVGLAQATKWINQGHRTLSDLVSKAHLSKNQLIGIEHYDDFQTRIPRKEVESHGEFLHTIIHQVDPTIQITIGGSYRRGAPDSGDVDFILTKLNCAMGILHTIIFHTVLPILQERGYAKASLAISSKEDGSKWHGAVVLPDFGSVWRRVDFLLVPWDEMGAALIYFTGNDVFNRSIRLLARKKGLRLNQHGLWRDVMGGARSGGGERSTRGTLVEGRSEERIFELLGVPYRPPEHRIC